MSTTIRVLIVDDHWIVRQGLKTSLSGVEGIEVVGETSDGREAVRNATQCAPDVVLMDVLMPGMDGAEATAEIARELPQVRVVLLTGTQTDPRIIDAIRAGALGYLSKSADRDELVATIRRVHAGQPSLPPEITTHLLQDIQQSPSPAELTPREQEILSLVARGLTNQQIAETIHISEATVRTHMSHILRKVNASNRVEAALWALRHGVAELDYDG